MEKTPSFWVHKVYLKLEEKLKPAIIWVNSSEFNRIHNRSYARSKVIVAFASEWISDTGRQEKGLGNGCLQRERNDRTCRACGR